MADNVEITAGTGTTVATDEVSAAHYQVVKIGVGAANAVDGHLDYGQAAAAASLPVVVASDQEWVKAEDAAHTTGDKGIMALAVRQDTPAALAGTAADYIPLTTDKLGAVWTTPEAATPHKNIDVDESEDAVSANPCRIMGFVAYNLAAAGSKRFLKFYNDTVGNVVVGTTTPVFVLPLDGGQGGVFPIPLLFSTACTIAATTGVADADTGAPGANEVVFSCGYLDL